MDVVAAVVLRRCCGDHRSRYAWAIVGDRDTLLDSHGVFLIESRRVIPAGRGDHPPVVSATSYSIVVWHRFAP